MNFFQKNKSPKIIKKYQVLFVCTGNSCRSPMAEGIFKKIIPIEYKEKINVFSAGTGGFINAPATFLAIEVAMKHGVDIQFHRSQAVTRYLLKRSNIVFAMAQDHEKYLKNCYPESEKKVFLLKAFVSKNKQKLYCDVDDPIGRSKEFYSKIYREIETELKRILPEILKQTDDYFQNK